MKTLTIDFESVIMAMQSANSFIGYLDLETGECVELPHDEAMMSEEFLEEVKDKIQDGERWVEIPQQESYEGWNLMAEFAQSVKNDRLYERLADALKGRGAFRRFKDVLLNYPEQRKEWFAFERERMSQEVRDWLRSINIEPVEKTWGKTNDAP